MSEDQQMTWDEVVAEWVKAKAKIEQLQAENKRLKDENAGLKALQRSVIEQLNYGDGSYRP